MKKYSFLLFLNILAAGAFCQSFQFANTMMPNAETQRAAFYNSCGDSTIDRIIFEELQSLSATYFITPACYYFKYKTDKDTLLSGYETDPNLQDQNVYVDLSLLKGQTNLNTLKTNIVNMLAHQFAGIIADKYKIDLSFKQLVLFTDYIAGNYIGNRNKYFKYIDVNIACQAQYITEVDPTNAESFIAPESRSICLKQGYDDLLNASQKRRSLTLRDIIDSGIDFVISRDL